MAAAKQVPPLSLRLVHAVILRVRYSTWQFVGMETRTAIKSMWGLWMAVLPTWQGVWATLETELRSRTGILRILPTHSKSFAMTRFVRGIRAIATPSSTTITWSTRGTIISTIHILWTCVTLLVCESLGLSFDSQQQQNYSRIYVTKQKTINVWSLISLHSEGMGRRNVAKWVVTR